MIQVNQLEKRYSSVSGLHASSFNADRGECIAVIGPNGAGKTTLFGMLSGEIRPDSGEVHLEGISLRENPQSAKRLLGIAPQGMGYLPLLTAGENLTLMGTLRGLSPSDLAREREGLLHRLNLLSATNQLATHFSEGMGQKLSIAMALIGSPPVLLLDESFNGLDPSAVAVVKDMVQERIEDGSLVLFTTHILAFVDELASRIFVIREGYLHNDLSKAEWNALKEEHSGVEGAYNALLQEIG